MRNGGKSFEAAPQEYADIGLSTARPRTANGKSRAGRRFVLVPFDQIKLNTECAHLVRDIIPREGLTVVWGPPKCGKSFFVFDLVLHVALGWEYRGRKVTQGPVVYVACEGERGLGARAAAFRQRYLDSSHEGAVPFHLLATRLDLVGEHGQLIADISGTIGETKPIAIVIDTLNRSLAGSENSDEDMSAYVQAADAVREAFKCAVVIIHHCGIEGTRPRGHTSLSGAADALIAVRKDEGGIIMATVTDMKDGAAEAAIASRLESVIVGTDATGEEITSCIVLDTEAPSPKPKGKKPIPGDYARAREFLADIVAKGGITVAMEGVPASTKVVTIDAWKAALQQRGLIGDGTDREGAAARDWLRKMKRRLIGDNLIREQAPYVWLCK